MSKTLLVCLCAVTFVFWFFLATPAQASVEISSTSLNFGSVTVNSSGPAATVVITNDNRGTISIESISSSASQFVVGGISLPLALSPHSTTSFTVFFRPTAAQTYSGMIEIFCGGRRAAERISVSGTGIGVTTEILTPSTSAVAFGSALVGSSVNQSVSLKNTGTGSVTVSSVTTSGTGFSVSGFSGAVTLSAGQSLTLSASFAPPQTGSTSGSLVVTSNATNSPATIALSGTGVQPRISVSPASLSFGSLNTGQTASQTLTISNPGTASLSVTQATVSGTGFSSSGLTLPLTIAANGSSSFTMNFAPTTAGTFSGTLTLTNNSATPSLTVALSGTGVVQTLQVSASPTSLGFGSVLTGSSATKTVTLTNTGNASVSLSSDAVSETGFSVTGLTLPMTLSAGQSTSFTVAFAPTATGTVSGSVTVTSNATNSPASISLSGTGVQPLLSVAPASASFGNVTAGVTNTQTLTLSNPGSASVTISQASMSGTGFAYSGLAAPLTIAAGGSSSFTISFDPTTAGSFSGTLTLVNNSPTPSLAIGLSGTGIAQTLQLSAAPASLSFGNVTVGSSATNTATLTNTGNANVSLASDSVSGSGFSVTGLALPLTLSAGQSTSFSVVFNPSAAGSISGGVTITSNASNSPTTISLSGSGVAASYSVMLSWSPSSSSYSGFNMYRSTVSGGPYTKLDSSLIASPAYTDTNVTAGTTYYYVVTEVDSSGNESAYSSQVSAAVP